MKSWLKGNVRVFRQGYKEGREIARKMHRLGAKNQPQHTMIDRAEKLCRRVGNDK
jgi:SLT domain-containing protein